MYFFTSSCTEARAGVNVGLSIFDSFGPDKIIKIWTLGYYIGEKIRPRIKFDAAYDF